MTIASALRQTVLVLGGLLFLLLALLVVSNLWDDDLDPQLVALLEARPAQIAAADNGYFAWIGVAGPENQPPHEWGQSLFADLLAGDRDAVASNQPPDSAVLKALRNDGLKREQIPCNVIDDCLSKVAADLPSARAILNRSQLTLTRGDRALDYPAYQEAARLQLSLQSQFVPQPTSWTALASTRFAVTIAAGRHDAALAQLAREMAFHRRQLAGSETLLDRMLAQAALRQRYLLLSQYLRQYPAAARTHGKAIAAALVPLSTEATRLKPAFDSETRQMARLLLNMKASTAEASSDEAFAAVPQWLLRLFYLPQASANDLFHTAQERVAADGLSGEPYRRALAEIRANTDRIRYSPRNPIGNILTGIANPAYAPYFARRDDLLALQALVAFQLELLSSGENKDIAGALAAAGERLTHPYTGERPVWNAERRTLGYPALPERSGKALEIRL